MLVCFGEIETGAVWWALMIDAAVHLRDCQFQKQLDHVSGNCRSLKSTSLPSASMALRKMRTQIHCLRSAT